MKETIVDKFFHLFETSIIVFIVTHGFVFILLFASYGGLSSTGSILFAFIIGVIYSVVQVPKKFPKRLKNPLLFTVTLSVVFTTIVTFMLAIENMWIQGVIIFLGFLWGWFGGDIIEKMLSDEN